MFYRASYIEENKEEDKKKVIKFSTILLRKK